MLKSTAFPILKLNVNELESYPTNVSLLNQFYRSYKLIKLPLLDKTAILSLGRDKPDVILTFYLDVKSNKKIKALMIWLKI